MNQLEIAIKLDMSKDYLAAVQAYEDAIESRSCPAEFFINLSFLYWEFAAEFAFRDANKISDKWGVIGGEKYRIVLEKGLSNYPLNVELHFWSKYFPHRLNFDPFSKEECLALIERFGDSESLVPYFFLYLFDKEKYSKKRNTLIMICENTPTGKNNYIKSIIE
jgi:hypothetical protein